MDLSARNQLQGTVKSVLLGTVMAEVVVGVNGQEIVSMVTRASAERLGLTEGSASGWSSSPPTCCWRPDHA